MLFSILKKIGLCFTPAVKKKKRLSLLLVSLLPHLSLLCENKALSRSAVYKIVNCYGNFWNVAQINCTSQVYLSGGGGGEGTSQRIGQPGNKSSFLGPKPESGAFTFKAASFWLATKGGS